MAIKSKKLLAIILAAATAAASVPTAYLFAASADSDTADTTDTADSTAASDESGAAGEDAGQVNEDGEVVMEGAVGTIASEDQITIKDYEMVAENDNYRMYYYEDRLSVILENKATGKLMYSTLMDAEDDGLSNPDWNAYMKSGIVCDVIVGTVSGFQLNLVNIQNTITTTKISNGIEAKVYYPDYGLGYTVDIVLDGDKLNVTIPDDSIVEDTEGTYFASISMFPFMGYTYMDDQDGYMLVPDGNGALIYLDNKEGRYSSGFAQDVYGSDAGFLDSSTTTLLWEKYDIVTDSYQVMAPIFGMAHLDDQFAYLAVIESGDKRAVIQADPNGASVNYNRCFAKFTLRTVYTQPLNQSSSGAVAMVEEDRAHDDLSVSYFLLSGEDANYTGMAIAYRNYLLDNGLVKQADTDYNTRVDFLGTDREEFLIGTRAVTVTTVDQMEEMFNELQGNGVSSLLSVYRGWQKGGLYNIPISKYKADSHIGGTSALTDFIEDSAKKNYQVYLYNNALEINADQSSFTFNSAKMVNKRILEIDTHQEVFDTFYYQLPSKTKSTLESFVSSYTKKGVNNLAIAGISDHLFSYSSKGRYYSRQDCAEKYSDILADVSENTNLILEQPSAYLWQYTDAILDMPLGSSDYMYLDQEVPFLSIVLKGIVPMYSEYVNFEANKTEYFLKMVESGVYPSFYLTYENSSALIYTNSKDLYSTEFTTYKETVEEYDKELRALAEKIGDANISKHEILDNGVTKVTYSNGVVIYVNYSDSIATVDGVTIQAMSYEVGDAQ